MNKYKNMVEVPRALLNEAVAHLRLNCPDAARECIEDLDEWMYEDEGISMMTDDELELATQRRM